MSKYIYRGFLSYIGGIEELSSSFRKRVVLCKNHLGIPTAFQITNKSVFDIDKFELQEEVEIEFFINCNSWNSKWFTNLNIVTIKRIGAKKAKANTTGSKSSSVNWFAGCKTKAAIKKKYRDLCKEHHPDKGGDENIMKDINNQYDKVK